MNFGDSCVFDFSIKFNLHHQLEHGLVENTQWKNNTVLIIVEPAFPECSRQMILGQIDEVSAAKVLQSDESLRCPG